MTTNSRQRQGPRFTWRGLCLLVITLVTVTGQVVKVRAQQPPYLGSGGEQLLVSSQPRFLIFVSYFDALDVSGTELIYDLDYLRSKGFDGIRVFPNWWHSLTPPSFAGDTVICASPGAPGCVTLPTSPYSMSPYANVRMASLNALVNVIARAAERSLLVEIAFSGETVSDNSTGYAYLSVGQNQEAIRAISYHLDHLPGPPYSFGNVLFDLQNESNIVGCPCAGNEPPQNTTPCRTPLAPADVGLLRAAVDDVSPWRLSTASTSGDTNEATTAQRVRQAGLDIATYHTPRVPEWWTQEGSRLSVLHSNLVAYPPYPRPMYLNEPEPLRELDSPYGTSYVKTGQQLITALQGAKSAGAAAWCFHTEKSFNMNGTNLRTRLSAEEQFFVNNFRAAADSTPWGMPGGATSLNLRTAATQHYMVAESGGGQAINANRTSAWLWERFTLIDRTGGELVHGDTVSIRSYDGVHYLSAMNGGGGTVSSAPTYMGPWETFTIERVAGVGPGTVIRLGDQVAIRTMTGHYLSAVNGGGAGVTATSAVRGVAESFVFAPVQP